MLPWFMGLCFLGNFHLLCKLRIFLFSLYVHVEWEGTVFIMRKIHKYHSEKVELHNFTHFGGSFGNTLISLSILWHPKRKTQLLHYDFNKKSSVGSICCTLYSYNEEFYVTLWEYWKQSNSVSQFWGLFFPWT